MISLGMIKFSHTLFALPFALLGAALAAHGAGRLAGPARDWLGILLCMATARSAAMAFNRLADRRIDAAQPADRRAAPARGPALGRLGRGLHGGLRASAFVASTLLFLPNRWPLVLSVPVLLWLLGYSYAKRFTSLAHFWLGASLMLAPIAAWIALRGDLALAAGAARPGGAVLGRRLRHHLRLPGRRLRPASGPAQHPRPAGRAGGACGWRRPATPR